MGEVWQRLVDTSFTDHTVTKAILQQVARFILASCYFTFNGSVYRQIVGSPTGSNMSGVAANCFMSILLAMFLSSHQEWSARTPLLGGMLGDIMGFWIGTEARFDVFMVEFSAWSATYGRINNSCALQQRWRRESHVDAGVSS